MACKSSSAWCRWALWFPQTTTKDPRVGYCLSRDPLAERSLKGIFTLSLILLSKWLHYASPDVFWPCLFHEDLSSGRAFSVCLKMLLFKTLSTVAGKVPFTRPFAWQPQLSLAYTWVRTFFPVFSFTEPQIIIDLGMIKDRPVNKIKENENKNTVSLCISQNVPLRLWTSFAVFRVLLSVFHSGREGTVHPVQGSLKSSYLCGLFQLVFPTFLSQLNCSLEVWQKDAHSSCIILNCLPRRPCAEEMLGRCILCEDGIKDERQVLGASCRTRPEVDWFQTWTKNKERARSDLSNSQGLGVSGGSGRTLWIQGQFTVDSQFSQGLYKTVWVKLGNLGLNGSQWVNIIRICLRFPAVFPRFSVQVILMLTNRMGRCFLIPEFVTILRIFPLQHYRHFSLLGVTSVSLSPAMKAKLWLQQGHVG